MRLLPIALLSVIATGIFAGAGRVEFPTPLTARLSIMPVTFYDMQTQTELPNNVLVLWKAALQRRLALWVRVLEVQPDFVTPLLQSIICWLSLWLAVGLTGFLFSQRLTTPLWWQIGGIVGSLFSLKLLHAVAASYWIWAPNWQPDLVDALADMLVGIPVPSAMVWAVSLRGLFWSLTALLFLVGLFFAIRNAFKLSVAKTLLCGFIAYLLARLIYALAMIG